MFQCRLLAFAYFLLQQRAVNCAVLLRTEGQLNEKPAPNDEIFHMYPVKKTEETLDLMRSFQTTGRCKEGDEDLIRVGPKTDGGYVICKHAAQDSSFMISIGIKGDDPISTGISEQFGVPAEQYDCFSGPSECPEGSTRCNVHFNKICAAGSSTETRDGTKGSKKFETLESMVQNGEASALQGGSTAKQDSLILKIDCEGCEWEALAAVPESTLKQFRMIVGELHWLDNQANHSKYLPVMQKLLTHHRLVHTHGCNCFGLMQVDGTEYRMPKIVEFMAIRKDLSVDVPYNGTKHLDLDAPVCNDSSEIMEEHWNLPKGKETVHSA
jgi:hypothetical protein